MEELGIDRPGLFFLLSGVALQPDDGARLVDVYNPYSTILDGNLAAASAARSAGLVDEAGGKWRTTKKGTDLYAKFRREQDAFFAGLEPIARTEIARLASLLGRALAAIEASDVPKDHLNRVQRYRGDENIPMVALDDALFGLWQARDDCHISSWRRAGFGGPLFDVLTRVWRKEAANEADLVQKLPGQHADDVAAAVRRLREDGLVESGTLAVTARGAGVRQKIEDETDRMFFTPWPADVGREATWIRDRLATMNEALKAAS